MKMSNPLGDSPLTTGWTAGGVCGSFLIGDEDGTSLKEEDKTSSTLNGLLGRSFKEKYKYIKAYRVMQ